MPPRPSVVLALLEPQRSAPRRPEPRPELARRYRRSLDRPATLDVTARYNDIISIARSHDIWRTCLALGWDPDDLEQELLERVWRRQSMKSRYQPERAGLSKYLFVLSRSILLNLIEKTQSRVARAEQIGMAVNRGGGCQVIDAAEAAVDIGAPVRVLLEGDDDTDDEPEPVTLWELLAE